jgi:uncharacterized protein (DUF58 family)
VLQDVRDALYQRFVAWALRVRPPEPAPIVLSQRRVYVLPTRPGLAFAGALLVMLVGAINYTLSLGYVLTFLLAGLGVAAILHTFRNLAGLRILPGRSDPVFANELARFSIVLDNLRNEPRYALRLNLPNQAGVEIDVSAAASALPTLTTPANRRGWLPMPRLTIATTYPLGLVRAWSYAAPDQRCLVYPAPAADAPPLPLVPGREDGYSHGGRGLDDFFGLRDHQLGDSPRHIAWKAVARHDGPLLTKEFSAAAAQRVVLDWDDLPSAMDVEQRLSVLARWVCQAHGEGIAWALHLPGKTLPFAAGAVHYHACLKALALYGHAQ